MTAMRPWRILLTLVMSLALVTRLATPAVAQEEPGFFPQWVKELPKTAWDVLDPSDIKTFLYKNSDWQEGRVLKIQNLANKVEGLRSGIKAGAKGAVKSPLVVGTAILLAGLSGAELSDVAPEMSKILTHLGKGEWMEAIDQAGKVAAGISGGFFGGEIGGAIGVTLAGVLCATVAMPVCLGLMAVLGVGMTAAGSVLGDQLGTALYCRARRGQGACEPTPKIGEKPPPSQAPSPSLGGSQTADKGGGQNGGQGAGKSSASASPTSAPSAPRGGARVSGRINASAGDLTASAQGPGARAVNQVGVVASGGNTSVQDVTTTARAGQSAQTTVNGAIVEGDIVNEGGEVRIQPGAVIRNGQMCLDFFRSLCIVSFYYPDPRDPCAPGYLRNMNRCDLPSDYKLQMRRR